MRNVHREHREWTGELPTIGEGHKRKFAVGDVVRSKRRGWLFRITRAQGWLDDGTPYYNVEGITHPELKGFFSETVLQRTKRRRCVNSSLAYCLEQQNLAGTPKKPKDRRQ